MSRNGGYSFRVLQAVADSTLHTIKVYQPFISAVIGPHVSNAVLWLAVSQSPRPLTETLGQTLGWQYSGHTSPDLDLTPAITTNRHGRHIPPEIQRNARAPFSELNIINYLSVPTWKIWKTLILIISNHFSVNFFVLIREALSRSLI